MSNSKLDRLHQLLLDDETERNKEEAKRNEVIASTTVTEKLIQQFWSQNGMQPPFEGVWRRPLPFHLFRTPLSSPQTTLVSWKSIPKPVQESLNIRPNENGIVEVPISVILSTPGQGMETNGKNFSQDNFANKLQEYTRGVVGQIKPFRAGGMDPMEEKPENPYASQECINRSLKPLDQGIEESWIDGTLLTTLPGLSADIGLRWEDVYPTDKPAPRRDAVTDDLANVSSQSSIVPIDQQITSQQNYKGKDIWERSYFDDDSLFGDSSREDSDDDEDDDDDAEMDKTSVATAKETTDFEFSSEKSRVQKEKELAFTGVEDVDELLNAMTLDYTTRQPTRQLENENNPLQLAHDHAELSQDASRKTWAVTKLLPIDDFDSWVPNPAISYPFKLDGFQQQAIARIERSESIFVAAHTSAGKTVCAEYAIALCKQHCTRCVYTSPIKALSNQKFRDFCQKFGSENIGLVTGDMQINVEDSSCLIMTTEILRSMLYRGANLIRDIEWVVFDEVHYVNDSERGVVWEEVIIMLPQYVNMIFLSATTPNTIEFSDWIGRTKRKPVHVIRTSYRPVPLSHHLWAGLKLHKILEGTSGFLENGHTEACKVLKPSKDATKGDKSKNPKGTGSKNLAWQQSGSKADWMSLIRYLDREGLTPTVTFSFSKKKCEEIANMLRSLDLNTAAERSTITGFTIQTVARLSVNDAQLPQVLTVCEMVKRGIGIHHGGLLPILKEMVEILFSRNFIKVLFATETFAMGVNMPARSVVFNSIRKHDGMQFRELEPGEYTQMAGRAGRRGLDKVGTVILCCFGETPPPLQILRKMTTGSSTLLKSQFRLTYNMILNLLRVEDMSVEGMIKRSFSEFATQRALTANDYPKLLTKGEKTLSKLDTQCLEDAKIRLGAEDLETYFDIVSTLQSLNEELLTYLLDTVGGDGGGIFTPGRILLVTAARKYGYVRAPAILIKGPGSDINFSNRNSEGSTRRSLICLVLLPDTYLPPETESDARTVASKPGTLNYIGESNRRYYAIHEIALNEIVLISESQIKIDPNTLLLQDSAALKMSMKGNPISKIPSHGRNDDFDFFSGMKAFANNNVQDTSGKKAMKKGNTDLSLDTIVIRLISAELEERESGIQLMDIQQCTNQGKGVIEFRVKCSKMKDLIVLVRHCISHRHPALESHYALLERKETLRRCVEALRHLLSNESLQLFPDFLQRKAVLKTLGYIDDNDTVCVKGRVACEVNTCQELIATEMVFEGSLNELEPAEIVAALSALVFQEKRGQEDLSSELPSQLLDCCQRMQTIALNLGQLQKEHGLDIEPADFSETNLKFGLVHVVYEWALGVSFKDICDLTDVQEGSIVRTITRLDELCREIRNCARVVGNPTLYGKMEAASVAIKRDIVFASSLYVS